MSLPLIGSTPDKYGCDFYRNIISWKAPESLLRRNGFPRPHAEKGKAVIHVETPESPPQQDNIRTCFRCKKSYQVDENNFAVVKEDCIYHNKRLFRRRNYSIYPCCNGSSGSVGCRHGDCHIYFNYSDKLDCFVKTQPKRERVNPGIFAIDCEMAFTTEGIELTKVTIVDSSCNIVYDTFVVPKNPIIDLSTEFSGVTEEDISSCTTTLADVQIKIMDLFSDKTIVIGHSLNSDFLALKLFHDTVIDTAILYPHHLGLPYKRALKTLAKEFLGKDIQLPNNSHNSAEDAITAMNLVIHEFKHMHC